MSTNVNIDSLLTALKSITIDKESRDYLLVYQEFITFYKNKKKISFHDLVIGIHFTYGWMPTMFNFRSSEFELGVTLLNKVKKGKRLDEQELISLKGLFNNSLVGTSKLLHFINPEMYAIWDSRVYRYLYPNDKYQYKLNKPSMYIEYLDLLKKMEEHNNFKTLKEESIKILGDGFTNFRIMEVIMYTKGVRVH